MRNVVFLVLGMAIGTLGAANIVNALRQRDAYPRGLMQVMQHHYRALRDVARLQRCNAASRLNLQMLQQLSGSIETAVYGAEPPAESFQKYATQLRNALAQTPSGTLPVDCAKLTSALNKVGAACDDCHRQYR